jgi:hypothetical protein
VTGITNGKRMARLLSFRALAILAGLPLREGMIGNEGTVTVSSEHDIGPAQKTYSGFVGLFKWGTIASIAVAILVVLLIA